MSQQITEDKVEFDQPLQDENEQLKVPESERTIYTDKGDPEIESLYGKSQRGKLILQADFQRYFVWDPAKSSRLIESALLEIPLPIIYLAEDETGKEYVIDGQQRLTSFFSFMNGKFPDGKNFTLTGLRVLYELNGKSYKDLGETLQDKIRFFKVHTITFKKGSDQNLRFEIFERLNTGAVALNDQELRNCVYRGHYNDLLKELARDKDFMYLLGLKQPDKRMDDIELVLRFAAFYHATYLKYKPPMKAFLKNDMEQYPKISEKDEDDLRYAFKNSVTIIKSLLGNHAFKRFYRGDEGNPNGHWEQKKFNASLFDIEMNAFATMDKNVIFQDLDGIREALIQLMTSDQGFIESIELSTSSIQAVTKRFDLWRLALQDVVGISRKEPRCFSHKLKEDLYNNNSTCTLCGQKILNIDDAAVDHIEQYWTGGKTVPENARLTHKYCNVARPRKD